MKICIGLLIALLFLGCAPASHESFDSTVALPQQPASPAPEEISFDGKIIRFEDLRFRMTTWVATFETTEGEFVKCRLGSPSHPLFKRLGLGGYSEIEEVKDFSPFPRFRIHGKKSKLVPDAWELSSWRVIDSE